LQSRTGARQQEEKEQQEAEAEADAEEKKLSYSGMGWLPARGSESVWQEGWEIARVP